MKVVRRFEAMIEEERNGLHEDPGGEQRVWLEKLAAADRKSSGFQDMAAEGLITFLLVFVIIAVATDERVPAGVAPLVAGFASSLGAFTEDPYFDGAQRLGGG